MPHASPASGETSNAPAGVSFHDLKKVDVQSPPCTRLRIDPSCARMKFSVLD